MFMLTFAEFLAKRRAAFGMSMTELAARLMVTPQYISLLESGRCNPSKKLQERCAKFFDEDIEYIRFLSQPMPRAQKEALLRNPSALPFLSHSHREVPLAVEGTREAVPLDAEDRFIYTLFSRMEKGELSDESKGFYRQLIAEIRATTDTQPRFSAKARAWADLYDTLLATDGKNLAPATAQLEDLMTRLDTDTHEPYPEKLRLEVSRRLATALMQSNRFAEAGATYERVAHYARLIEDADGIFDGYQNAVRAYQHIGRLETILSMLSHAAGVENIPAAIKARLYVMKAHLLYNLADAESALEPIQQAVRIWRLRSLDISDKTARLVATQVLGLHCFVERGDQAEARQWLGRIRSTLARVTEAEVPLGVQMRYAAECDLESAALMIAQARWNHALKNIDDVCERVESGAVAFEDEDDKVLLRLRLAWMRGVVAHGKRQPEEALRLAYEVVDSGHLADPVRDKGRRAYLFNEASRLLRLCGDPVKADAVQTQLLDELDPAHQSSETDRMICETDAIRRLREQIAATK